MAKKEELDVQTLLATRRWCYYIPLSAFEDGKGYRVSIIVEGEEGHFPTGTPDKAPWYWGMTYRDAEQTAAEANAKLGIDETTVVKLLMSSMRGPGPRRTKAKAKA